MSVYSFGWSRTEIDIPDDWRMLDVGSGHNPHPRANVCLDNEAPEGHRRGRDVVRDERYQRGDVLDMPFPDQSFDFISALNLAEHVADPGQFCRELMRVGKGGYIESPSPVGEFFLPQPPEVHPWLTDAEGGTFIWYRKPRDWRPFSDTFVKIYYGSPVTQQLMSDWITSRKVVYCRYLWSGSFKWEIREYDREAIAKHATRRVVSAVENIGEL